MFLLLLATGACARAGSATAGTVPTPAQRTVKPVAGKSAPVAKSAGRDDPATRDEVVSTAVAMFGDGVTQLPDDSSRGLDDPSWDIDVRSYETHDRVEHYVELFSNTGKERFRARLSRGTRYEPMIRAKLRAGGLPEDLMYLALIESGYDPHAYSRAAAVGMWQFMSSTARGVGLRVDWWMDERRDPARSTDGAIRFLSDLQRQFGSLYLAAAAYNGGPGRVARGLTRYASEMDGAEGEDRFFALAEQDYLRAETKNYVPQIIAAALVAKMPARYGLVVDSLPLYAYDSVLVTPGTSLAQIAAASGATKAELRDLNPAVLRGITPPDASIWARVPLGVAERTRLALDSVPPDDLRGFAEHSVSGTTTTPAAFAKKHGVTLQQLRWFNPTIKTTKKGRLVADQTLRVPREVAIDFAREIPDPSIERYGSTGSARARAGTARKPTARKATASKTTARKGTATKTASKKTVVAKKSPAAKKAPVTKKKTSAKKAPVTKKKTSAKKTPAAKKKTASSAKKTPSAR